MEKVFDEQTGALLATLPIDTSAVAAGDLGDMRAVSGPAELNQRMIESGKVEACLSANYFRYALRRDRRATAATRARYEAMRGGLASGGAWPTRSGGIASSAGFRQRKVGGHDA